ncbi:hypothetical protein WN51_08945 [Melipona quadrifasciata]|uniref:Uncharacterized protein n=1 Tax=Melipona quadrifasciata TaxID=166423 RepID=A0A0M8ZQD8_9HYME|nr:hypothetical protein WN51_08945 [Melipona quadrifasciata]
MIKNNEITSKGNSKNLGKLEYIFVPIYREPMVSMNRFHCQVALVRLRLHLKIILILKQCHQIIDDRFYFILLPLSVDW